MDSLGKSFNPNKRLKEAFVSNLTGSSMLQIVALSTIVPVLMILGRLISYKVVIDPAATETSLKKNDNSCVGSKNWRAYMATMAVEFLFIILPILLFFTVLAEWTNVCAILFVFLLLYCIAVERFGSTYFEEGPHALRKNISSYRVSMMIVTCLCILAVDYKIFPRRYAKTETYGNSLMDLGVGSFVLANSLVSRQVRRNAYAVKWKTALQSTSPLIFLGFGRLVSTAGVDYQVHVGEYGVHWNFFFTLAAVSILSSLINLPPKYCGILGSLILIGYQIFLMHELNVYLLSDERGMNYISQNKEGIFSIFGYWGMYLVGVQMGNYLFFGNESTTLSISSSWARSRVWFLSLLFWLLTVLLDWHVERVSRRMCNLACVTMVLAQNLQVLAILMLSDYIPGRKTLVLEEAFNQNLLGSFLLANLLTGLVNLFVDTLFVSSVAALVILLVYAFILSAITGFAHFYGIKLKFW
ncbi:hypothetical protein L1049_000459 [Liquidambar formosana]|uniref:GPI-anchored wall transfer protein n=1 Tax=Liquidambar formosana TaxID=63359 RepID=A0AAP0NCT1_LIQFO